MESKSKEMKQQKKKAATGAKNMVMERKAGSTLRGSLLMLL